MREKWIDNIKLIACVLVAMGRLVQGLTSAGIMDATGVGAWVNKTVYYIHVPLFFFCSGYIYQRYTCEGSWRTRIHFLLRKAITLGIPYLSFSIITWLMKEIFSGAVNEQNGVLWYSLLVEPMSPYWYLYILFFLHLILPVFRNNTTTILITLCALVLKIMHSQIGETGIYIITKVMQHGVWFVCGMCFAWFCVKDRITGKKWISMGVALLSVFLAASIWMYQCSISSRILAFAEGLLGCVAVILLVINMRPAEPVKKMLEYLSRYTMPIYLMHTIFAAGLRSVLIKVGLLDLTCHVCLGMLVSITGPIVAAEIMRRVKIDVLIYPGKYISLKKRG